MKCTVSFLLSILSFTILFVQPAHGQIRPFVPRILGYSGEVRVDSLYETEIEESQNNRIERVKTTFRQDLKLDLFGYTYHPRFNIFSIRGSLGLDQRKLKLNDNRQPWNFTTSDQYDIRTIFLPQHPYNLELFTSQSNPILAGSLSSDKPSQTRESGAIFKYDLEPWLVNARFISTKISDQNDRNTRSNLYDGNVTYTNPIATLGGFVNHNEIVAESNDIEIDGFGAFNNLRIGVANLDTFYSVTQDDTRQNQVLISKRRRMSWNQTVSIPLPLRFSATGYYRQDEEIEGFTDPDTGQLFERFNDRNRLKLALQHRLYNSLTTSLDDVFRYVPGIDAAGGGSRFGTEGIIIRGIGGNRVLMELDGAPLNHHFAVGNFANATCLVEVVNRFAVSRPKLSSSILSIGLRLAFMTSGSLT